MSFKKITYRTVVYLLWILICTHADRLWAQTSGKLIGQVVDAVTGLPLAHAQVGFTVTHTYTLTNTSGQFWLPASGGATVGQRLRISHVGYRDWSGPVLADWLSHPPVLRLQPDTTELQGVTIVAKAGKSPKAILKKVLNRLSRNYDNGSYQLDAYFQTTAFHPWRQQPLLSFFEADLLIADEGRLTRSDTGIAMYLRHFNRGQDELPPMSFSDSLSLALFLKLVSGQSYFNEAYEVYSDDVVRHENGTNLSISPFRENAILKHNLQLAGTAIIDSVPCFRIIATSRTSPDMLNKNGTVKVKRIPFEVYQKIFPANVPVSVLDSMYHAFYQKLEEQASRAAPSRMLSTDREVLYINKSDYAVMRYERESWFAEHYYYNWVQYRRHNQRYYPAAMGDISPRLLREKSDPDNMHQTPYYISTMLVTAVHNSKRQSTKGLRKLTASDHLENLPLIEKEVWQPQIQIPFDANNYQLILKKIQERPN